MKKLLSIALVLMMVLALASCGSKEAAAPAASAPAASSTPASSSSSSSSSSAPAAASGPDYQEHYFELATAYASGEPCAQGAIQFMQLLEERSDGKLTGQVYTDGSAGTEQDQIQLVATGGIDCALGGSNLIDSYAPKYMFIGSPFVLNSFEHAVAVLNSDIGAGLNAALEAEGVKLLPYCNRGYRTTTSNIPFSTPAELNGIRFRLPNMPTWVAMWEGLGASPLTVALPELYAALQYGTADASEGPLTQITSYKLYEVQDYLVQTNHASDPTFIYINTTLWNSFNEDTQNLIWECAQIAMDDSTQVAITNTEAYIKECQEGGMEVVEIDRTAFEGKIKEICNDLFPNNWDVTTYDEVLALDPNK